MLPSRKIIFASLIFLAGKACYTVYAKDTTHCIRTTKPVNIREDSTVNSLVLTQTKKGEILRAVNEKYGWYKVILPKHFKAFVYASLTTITSDGYLTPAVDKLNIRMAPQKNSPVIGTIARGEKVKYIKKKRGWYEIYPYPFAYGWIIKIHTQTLTDDNLCSEVISQNSSRITKIKKEGNHTEPINSSFIGEGILEKADIPNCPANYMIKSNHSHILLETKGISNIDQFLEKRVKVWGKVKKSPCIYVETNYIEVEK